MTYLHERTTGRHGDTPLQEAPRAMQGGVSSDPAKNERIRARVERPGAGELHRSDLGPQLVGSPAKSGSTGQRQPLELAGPA